MTEDGQGQAKGILLEATRRGLDVMVKNDRLYKGTGGWGFDHFDGDTKTSRLPASDRMQCYTCHAKRSDRDYVYSSIRP